MTKHIRAQRPSLSPVAQAVSLALVAMAGLMPAPQAIAGPGYVDVTLQDGSTSRIQTFFAYSPSGVRVNAVPEGAALGLTADPLGGGINTGKALRKFVDPLPLPGAANAQKMDDGVTDKYVPVAVASKWVKPDGVTVSGDDYYEIAVVEFTDRFHSDLAKPSVLRGYVQIDHLASNGRGQLPGSQAVALTYPDGQPILMNGTDADGKMTGFKVPALAVDQPRFLGPVIAATRGIPTRVKFINLLPAGRAELGALDANGKPVVLARHGDLFFPTDKTIMGAGLGPDGMTEYSQNRADIHLHGGDTPWISDGTPHQWITPVDEADPANPRSLAAEFGGVGSGLDATLLPHYLRGDSAVNVPDMYDPGPGAMTYYFPNGQTARMLWYHDHSFGATRLNVYAGMASAYLLTDAAEQAMVGTVLPPAERTIPLVLQDRTFVPDDIALQDARWNTTAWGAPGDSWFPHVYETVQDPAQQNNWNAVGRWHYGPWFWPVFPSLYALPTGEYSPAGAENTVTTTPEAWMDTPILNGVAYPTMTVDPTTYRFRMLNASNDRVMTFNLFEAKDTVTLADGTVVTSPVGKTEIDMVPAGVPAAPCAAGVTRPQPIGTTGAVCTPASWPTDNRMGGVPDPKGVGPTLYQIASEGGWLPEVVAIEPSPITYIQDKGRITVLNVDTKSLLLAPAERADVVVDFSQYAGKTLLVYNDSGAPMPAGDPRNDLFTGVGDQSGSGGTEDTLPGYGPNIRTMMQIVVKPLPAGAAAPAVYDPTALQTALRATYLAEQERPTVAQPAYAGFDASWANLPVTQTYASIYTGSLKEPVFKFVPGTPNNGINSVTVSAGGHGYLQAPAVSISAPVAGGKAATAAATLKIDAIAVTTPGTGYTSAPVVAIVGGGGNGATATASLTIDTVNVTAGGSYTTAPTGVTFSAPPVGGTRPSGATITTSLVAGKYVVNGVSITTPGVGYTASPLVTFTGGSGTAARATTSGGVGAVKLSNPDPTSTTAAGGGGYTDLSQTIVNFTGGNGAGAVAQATGKVFDISLTSPGVGYGAAEVPVVTVAASPTGVAADTALAVPTPVAGGLAQANYLVKTKTIQELFDPTYGRLNATFGVELPFTSATTQTTIPLGYVDETTENFSDGETQIWKITHNGVDSHPVHFHLMNVQIINRVGWDGFITPPTPRELGWKETVVMSPLEDVIVAVKAKKPELPGFGVPLSVRLMDPSQPIGSPFGFTQIDPTTGFPKTVVNDIANYGWEYVWHCHILGHEENDFMRAVKFDANEAIPAAPTWAAADAAVASATGVALTWIDNASTEYKFDVLRADVIGAGVYGPFVSVGTGLANHGSFVDATAVGGNAVAYKVAAVGAAGVAESTAIEVNLTVGPPSAPTGLTAVGQSGSSVQLNWTDTATNETAYSLVRTVNGVATTFALAADAVAYGDTGLPADTAVQYALTATNLNGASTAATVTGYTLGAPALASLTATPNSATQVTLAWLPAALVRAQAVTSYTIVRTGGAGPVNFTVAAGTTSYVDTTLAQNTAYTYTVNAVNASGLAPAVNGAASSTNVTTLYAAAGALTGALATYTAAPTAGVTVSWTGGTPATAYLVERCTASAANLNCAAPTSVWAPAWTVNAPAGAYFDASVVANTTYAYRVTAKNGPTNLSNTLTALVTTPAAMVVNTPTGLTAAVSFAPARITLTWTDAATNETAFVIERSTDGVNFSQVGTALPRTGTTGQTRTFADTAVSAGQTYWYRVMAQNVTGAAVSNSAPTPAVKVDYFLTAPTGLTATIASATRVTLNWVDQSTAETSFAVWRSDNGAAAVQVGTVTRTAAQGTAVGGPATFNNNNSVATPLVAGHTYTYTVKAVNGAVVSAASNSISVPFLAPVAPAAPAVAVTPTSATRATVVVSWAAVPGATSYTVQRIAPGNVTTTVVTNTTLLAVTQTNVTINATVPYVYQVRANNAVGSSAYTPTSVLVK